MLNGVVNGIAGLTVESGYLGMIRAKIPWKSAAPSRLSPVACSSSRGSRWTAWQHVQATECGVFGLDGALSWSLSSKNCAVELSHVLIILRCTDPAGQPTRCPSQSLPWLRRVAHGCDIVPPTNL